MHHETYCERIAVSCSPFSSYGTQVFTHVLGCFPLQIRLGKSPGMKHPLEHNPELHLSWHKSLEATQESRKCAVKHVYSSFRGRWASTWMCTCSAGPDPGPAAPWPGKFVPARPVDRLDRGGRCSQPLTLRLDPNPRSRPSCSYTECC